MSLYPGWRRVLLWPVWTITFMWLCELAADAKVGKAWQVSTSLMPPRLPGSDSCSRCVELLLRGLLQNGWGWGCDCGIKAEQSEAKARVNKRRTLTRVYDRWEPGGKKTTKHRSHAHRLCVCVLKSACFKNAGLWREQDKSPSLLMLSFHSVFPSITVLFVPFLSTLNNNNNNLKIKAGVVGVRSP